MTLSYAHTIHDACTELVSGDSIRKGKYAFDAAAAHSPDKRIEYPDAVAIILACGDRLQTETVKAQAAEDSKDVGGNSYKLVRQMLDVSRDWPSLRPAVYQAVGERLLNADAQTARVVSSAMFMNTYHPDDQRMAVDVTMRAITERDEAPVVSGLAEGLTKFVKDRRPHKVGKNKLRDTDDTMIAYHALGTDVMSTYAQKMTVTPSSEIMTAMAKNMRGLLYFHPQTEDIVRRALGKRPIGTQMDMFRKEHIMTRHISNALADVIDANTPTVDKKTGQMGLGL